MQKKELHKKKIYKFLILLLILVAYFIFTTYKYGLQDGVLVSLTTWSFFVFCTPIADAGFLIDFPIRILTGLKMIYSEMIVWITAALITTTAFITNPSIFENSILLKLYHLILTNLYPYGGIILLSAIGTFLSIHLGDQIVDTSSDVIHKKKYDKHKRIHQIILTGFVIAAVVTLYYFMLEHLNINIKLF